MDLRVKLAPLTLVGGVAVTRFIFRSHLLYDIDSVNFALGMSHFDPRVQQPHPPGYFLYICLGRLLNTLLHDPNLALVILSIAASCGAVWMIYRMALEWFGPLPACFAGVLFLFSPLVWFHGTVALTYIVEAFFSALLGYLCWRMYTSRGEYALLTGVVLGVSAGLRPSSFLFLAPLFLLSLRPATPRRRFAGVSAVALASAAWFIPMIVLAGGWKAYFGALASLWRMVPSKGTIFNSSPINSVARAFTIIFIYFICFGVASLAPLGARFHTGPVDARRKTFTLVWIVPALCFFTFGYLKFVNSGYLLLLSGPACIWLGLWAAEWYEHARWRKTWKWALMVTCAAANVLIFLFSPLYCSYGSVRRFEGELASIQASLPQVGSPRDMLIVGFDSHFLGYRHAGYYLPEYFTIAYPVAHLKEGPRVFAMHDRETQLLTELPSASYTRFVLFPLPGDKDAYGKYLQGVEALLPRKDLESIQLNGHDFVTGPISDLPLLFSGLKGLPRDGVYAVRHSETPSVYSRSH